MTARADPISATSITTAAQDDGRTLSNWITHLIEREVKKAEKEKEK